VRGRVRRGLKDDLAQRFLGSIISGGLGEFVGPCVDDRVSIDVLEPASRVQRAQMLFGVTTLDQLKYSIVENRTSVRQ
jgi:hypothetical protein